MEWQQLEYFHMVAQTEHYTRAAERLAVSQPAVSRSIAKLEEELGIPLFERRGRGIALSRYGAVFYKRTSRILQEMEQAKREIADLLDPEYGTVSFAFLKSLGISTVPALIQAYVADHPHVHFRLFQNATNVMLQLLENGEVDFCLSTIVPSGDDIEWAHLWMESLFAYVPRNHPLSRRASVTIAELAAEKLIVLKQGYSSRMFADRMFAEASLTPNITFEADELVTIIGFVRANLGISILPQVGELNMDNIVCLPIEGAESERAIGLAWNKDKYLSPAARRFRQFVIDRYRE